MTFVISIQSMGRGNLSGVAIGNTTLDFVSGDDTEITISIAGNLTRGQQDLIGAAGYDASYQLNAFGDEITHAKQFLDGEIGYTDVLGEAVAYDLEDELDSRLNAVEAAISCGCTPTDDNWLIYDAGSREAQKQILKSNGYNLPNSRINVQTFLQDPTRYNTKGTTIYHRKDGKTVATQINNK